MKLPLFFHIREENTPIHTYCIDSYEGKLFIGYSITHENDQFKKSMGRKISQDRMIFGINLFKNKITCAFNQSRIEPVIFRTIKPVIEKSKKLLNLSNDCSVYICCSTKLTKNNKNIRRIVPFPA